MDFNNITYLDLFSGTGGFALGLQQAGFKFSNHYFSEIDKHAIANYLYNFKNAEYAGDVRTVSITKLPKRPNIIKAANESPSIRKAYYDKKISELASQDSIPYLKLAKTIRKALNYKRLLK